MKLAITKNLYIATIGLIAVFTAMYMSPLKSKAISFLNGSTKDVPSNSFNLNYVPGEVIVKFKEPYVDLDYGQSSKVATSYNLTYRQANNKLNHSTLKITDGKSVEEKIAELNNDPRIEYAEPNYIRQPYALGTDDTYAAQLWGLDNTGQTIGSIVGTADADIDMPEAWAITQGTNEIIVAIIDTGVAYNHVDLVGSMWDGTGCVDWDGNDLPSDCIHGYDFADDDYDPNPGHYDIYHSHGTHIAGTIAAGYNNTTGVAGIAPQVKIMALRSSLTTTEIVKAIDFAIQNGATVINASYGGPTFSQTEYEAYQRFEASGGIIAIAAGNSTADNDATDDYPGNYTLTNSIVVAATTNTDDLASFSNYGVTTVDVGAPGHYIFSSVVDQTLADHDFYTLPTGWTQTGDTWQVQTTYGLLVSDINGFDNEVYANNLDTTVVSDTYALGTYTPILDDIRLGVRLRCATENTDPFGANSDYVSVEFTPDGTNWTDQGVRWNAYSLGDGTGFYYKSVVISPSYLTDNFQYRFRWTTNDSDNNYYGCMFVSNTIGDFSHDAGTTVAYNYSSGTSMAAPHVAGLAGYLWSFNNTLTMQEVKDAITDNGDPLAALSGKTATGKRINAYNSLLSLGDDCIPAATPVGGEYTTSQSVTLTKTLCPAATIYYTLDGTTPTSGSTVYSTPISITPSGTTVLKAVTIDGVVTSSVLTETYSFPIKLTTTVNLEVTSDESANLQVASCTVGDCSTQVKNVGTAATDGTTTITSTLDTAGAYDFYIKPQYFLSQMQSATVAVGDNALTFSTAFTAGDLNNDDVINTMDYGVFAGMFGDAGAGDFNRDGIVNTIDFAVFYNNFGNEGTYFTNETVAWAW